jgi:predicted RNase H-like HicB family nuclease
MRQVIIHKAEEDETGYWAECPSLGVVSQGETIEETIVNIREAIELWLEVAEEYGDPIPLEAGND